MQAESEALGESNYLGHPQPERVDELWFEDGNVILQAGHSMFRLYKGILAKASPIFRDMFSLPQAEKPEVHLQNGRECIYMQDSAEDATVFLKAIFDSRFFERPPAITKFDVVVGILKLSTKYDVDYLRQRALIHFEHSFPLSLDDWEDRSTKHTLPLMENTEGLLILLFKELDAQWLLPAVMYSISTTHPVEQIVDGVPWEKSVPDVDPVGRRAYLIAHFALSVKRQDLVYRILVTRNFDCTWGNAKRDHCHESKISFLKSFGNPALETNAATIGEKLGTVSICASCHSTAMKLHAEERKKLWDELPGIFGLPKWDHLRLLRNAALSDFPKL